MGGPYKYPGGSVIAAISDHYTAKGRRKVRIAQVLTMRPHAHEDEIAEEAGVSSRNVVSLINELERDGHVSRTRNGSFSLVDPNPDYYFLWYDRHVQRRMELAIYALVKEGGDEGVSVAAVAKQLSSTPSMTRRVSGPLQELGVIWLDAKRFHPGTNGPRRRPKPKRVTKRRSHKESIYSILESDSPGVYAPGDFARRLRIPKQKAASLADDLVREGRIQAYGEDAYVHVGQPHLDRPRRDSFKLSPERHWELYSERP